MAMASGARPPPDSCSELIEVSAFQNDGDIEAILNSITGDLEPDENFVQKTAERLQKNIIQLQSIAQELTAKQRENERKIKNSTTAFYSFLNAQHKPHTEKQREKFAHIQQQISAVVETNINAVETLKKQKERAAQLFINSQFVEFLGLFLTGRTSDIEIVLQDSDAERLRNVAHYARRLTLMLRATEFAASEYEDLRDSISRFIDGFETRAVQLFAAASSVEQLKAYYSVLFVFNGGISGVKYFINNHALFGDVRCALDDALDGCQTPIFALQDEERLAARIDDYFVGLGTAMTDAYHDTISRVFSNALFVAEKFCERLLIEKVERVAEELLKRAAAHSDQALVKTHAAFWRGANGFVRDTWQLLYDAERIPLAEAPISAYLRAIFDVYAGPVHAAERRILHDVYACAQKPTAIGPEAAARLSRVGVSGIVMFDALCSGTLLVRTMLCLMALDDCVQRTRCVSANGADATAELVGEFWEAAVRRLFVEAEGSAAAGGDLNARLARIRECFVVGHLMLRLRSRYFSASQHPKETLNCSALVDNIAASVHAAVIDAIRCELADAVRLHLASQSSRDFTRQTATTPTRSCVDFCARIAACGVALERALAFNRRLLLAALRHLQKCAVSCLLRHFDAFRLDPDAAQSFNVDIREYVKGITALDKEASSNVCNVLVDVGELLSLKASKVKDFVQNSEVFASLERQNCVKLLELRSDFKKLHVFD